MEDLMMSTSCLMLRCLAEYLFRLPLSFIAPFFGAMVINMSYILILSQCQCEMDSWGDTATEFGVSVSMMTWSFSGLRHVVQEPIFNDPVQNAFFQVLDALVGLLVLLMSSGLRPAATVVCVLLHVAFSLTLFILSNVDMLGVPQVTSFGMTLMPCVVWAMISVFRRHGMAVLGSSESELSTTLVQMLCETGFWDGACWLDADVDTVAGGSLNNMDSFMNKDMQGHSFTECLISDADRELFRKHCRRKEPGVKVMPATICVDGQHQTAMRTELFILQATSMKGSVLVGLRRGDGEGEISANGLSGDLESHFDELSLSTDMDLTASNNNASGSYSVLDPTRRPSTLTSVALDCLDIRPCPKDKVISTVLSMVAEGRRQMLPKNRKTLERTLKGTIELVCDHVVGGALVLIAEAKSFNRVFPQAELETEEETLNQPGLHTSDGGYMTMKLKDLHVTQTEFKEAFKAFTEHSETDRWPKDHPDPEARCQPKDGALLLDVSGFRLKCAVKVLGLPPPRRWPGVGTKHEAALAAAWTIENCIAVVRSDSGAVHVVIKDDAKPVALRISATEMSSLPEIMPSEENFHTTVESL